MLMYAHENGCPWDESTCNAACEDAAETDDVEVLEYLIENGCPYDYEELWIIAEERGSSELLDYLCDLEDELDDELEDPAEINTVTIDFL